MVVALIKCDSLGNAYLKQIFYLKGANNSAPPTVEIKYNVLKVTVPVDSQAIYIQLRDRYESIETTVKNTPAPVEINVLTGWQWFQIWVGRISVLAIVIFLCIKLIIKVLKDVS